MVDFREAYQKVQDSVVGLGWVHGRDMHIRGTGFVIHSDGKQAIVLTNEHVVNALREMDDKDKRAIVFRDASHKDVNGEDVPFSEAYRLRIDSFGVISDNVDLNVPPVPGFQTIAVKPYRKPDLGIVVISTEGVSFSSLSLELEDCPSEGLPVGLLGYPRGLDITANSTGEDLQCTPILQTGILSAILPNRNSPRRTFMVHIYSSPGCSGSPLFDPTGRILGVVFGAKIEMKIEDAPKALLSSQLFAVSITELPDEFLEALCSNKIGELYEFLHKQSEGGKGVEEAM